jgi:hypothetical protein
MSACSELEGWEGVLDLHFEDVALRFLGGRWCSLDMSKNNAFVRFWVDGKVTLLLERKRKQATQEKVMFGGALLSQASKANELLHSHLLHMSTSG